MTDNNVLIYQDDNGITRVSVRFSEEDLWLTQAQITELYQTSKSNISEHIKNILAEGELDEISVVRKFRTTAAEVIYERVDNKKPLVGMTDFKGNYITKDDVKIAKNYLSELELQ